MLDPDFERRVREQIALAYEERDSATRRASGDVTSQFARRGTLRSSMAAHAIGNLYGAEIRMRAELSLARLQYVFQRTGAVAGDTFKADIEALLLGLLNDQHAHLKSAAADHVSVKQMPSTTAMVEQQLMEAREFAERTLRSEIELWTTSLALRSAGSPPSGGTVVNVHGSNYGAIQTGDASTAVTSTTVDTFAKEEIGKAVDLLEQILRELGEQAPVRHDDVEEIVTEIRSELRKDTPNQTRLKSLLSGVAAAIQTSAALRPAYDLIMDVISIF